MFIIVHRFLLILILWICSRCSSSCTSSQLPFFKNICWKQPLQGIAHLFRFNFATFQRTKWYHVVSDKSHHVAHKGFHDHFNPQIFMNKLNKADKSSMCVCAIQRQAWQFVVPAQLLEIRHVTFCHLVTAHHGNHFDVVQVKVHMRHYVVVYMKVHVRRHDVV